MMISVKNNYLVITAEIPDEEKALYNLRKELEKNNSEHDYSYGTENDMVWSIEIPLISDI